jgi:hypothetical protein
MSITVRQHVIAEYGWYGGTVRSKAALGQDLGGVAPAYMRNSLAIRMRGGHEQYHECP